jgi:hypothetical protein
MIVSEELPAAASAETEQIYTLRRRWRKAFVAWNLMCELPWNWNVFNALGAAGKQL